MSFQLPHWIDSPEIQENFDALALAVGQVGQYSPWRTISVGSAPAFKNSWVNGDGGTSSRPARFFKTSAGIVYLSGYISTGVAGTVAFTLPAGYRMVTGSASGVSFPIIQAGTGAAGYVDINPAGDVTPSVTPAFLDGVAFRGEQ